jgi:hypothetical protein
MHLLNMYRHVAYTEVLLWQIKKGFEPLREKKSIAFGTKGSKTYAYIGVMFQSFTSRFQWKK